MKIENINRMLAKVLWVLVMIWQFSSVAYFCYYVVAVLPATSGDFSMSGAGLYAINLLFGGIGVAVGVLIYYYVVKVMLSVSKGAPLFDETHVKYVKTAAYIKAGLYVGATIINIIMRLLWQKEMGISITNNFDMYFGYFQDAFPALLFICLAFVFNYGAALHREAEETL